MQVGQKNLQAFKDHFAQAYRHYQIRKKSTSAVHGYGASENHAHEKYAQIMNSNALKSLANAKIEDKEEMENLIRINLTLSQSLTQSQEAFFGYIRAASDNTSPYELQETRNWETGN